MVGLSPLMSTALVLYQKIGDYSPIYASMLFFYEKQINQVAPQQLIKMWNIGLKTIHRILKYTTHQCINTTVLLAKRFKTENVQLQYKQLFRRHGIFFIDFLKVRASYVKVLLCTT